MNKWLAKYTLRADTQEDLQSILMSIDAFCRDGELVTTSHNHSIVFVDKFDYTSVIITDEDSNNQPKVVRLDGCYAEVSVRDPLPALNDYAVTPDESVAEYYEKQAQALLSDLESSNVTIEGIEYQVRTQDIERINQKIGWMQRNSIESVEWIVADNTTQTCTVDDLYAILDAQQARQDSAIQQYTEWRLGDKQTPFEPTL